MASALGFYLAVYWVGKTDAKLVGLLGSFSAVLLADAMVGD